MIKFKMMEIQEMVLECLEKQFGDNVLEDIDQIMTECVGLHYQIPLQNFKEAKKRIIEIYIELARYKLIDIDPEYDDEVEYFLDMFEFLALKNLNLRKSFDLIIESGHAKYYVSAHLFKSLVGLVNNLIESIHKMDQDMKKSIIDIRKFIREKLAQKQQYIEDIQEEAQILA